MSYHIHHSADWKPTTRIINLIWTLVSLLMNEMSCYTILLSHQNGVLFHSPRDQTCIDFQRIFPTLWLDPLPFFMFPPPLTNSPLRPQSASQFPRNLSLPFIEAIASESGDAKSSQTHQQNLFLFLGLNFNLSFFLAPTH